MNGITRALVMAKANKCLGNLAAVDQWISDQVKKFDRPMKDDLAPDYFADEAQVARKWIAEVKASIQELTRSI